VLRLERRRGVAVCCRKKMHKEKGEIREEERRVDREIIN
jgi:hypothetical protein